MIDTALNGNQVVKCDDCHMEVESGWMLYTVAVDDGRTFHVVDDERHYCDECAERYECRSEFRICRRCGTLMYSGFTDEGNEMGYSFLCCEDCFEQEMAERFGEYRACDDGDGCGGYYEWYEPREQEWCGTGIYWTEWR